MASEKDQRPHVVALAFLTQGHITPLMNFCLKLAAQRVRVTFVTVDSASIGLGAAKQPPQIPHEFINDIFLEQLTIDSQQLDPLTKQGASKTFQAIANLSQPFEELVVRLLPKVCCIISDCMYSWSQDVSKKLGVPRASFWTAATASLAVDYSIPLLLEHGDIPVTETNKENVISYVPGLQPLKACQLPFIYHSGNFMTTSDPGYKRKIQRSAILPDDAWIITNSFEELEPEAFHDLRQKVNRNIIGAGPLISFEELSNSVASFWEQDEECLKWLNTKTANSVLYVSFGSAVSLTLEEFEELSAGIEASEHAFLWALRPGSVKSMSEEALESFKKRTESQGLVISWAPQVEVLSHESTGAFLTHCGWNSVLEGVLAGVPMLGWPKLAEQNLNCKLVEDMKIGYSLMKEQTFGSMSVGSVEIATKVRSAFCDAKIRERVRELQLCTKRAMESSQDKLEPFVTFLKTL